MFQALAIGFRIAVVIWSVCKTLEVIEVAERLGGEYINKGKEKLEEHLKKAA